MSEDINNTRDQGGLHVDGNGNGNGSVSGSGSYNASVRCDQMFGDTNRTDFVSENGNGNGVRHNSTLGHTSRSNSTPSNGNCNGSMLVHPNSNNFIGDWKGKGNGNDSVNGEGNRQNRRQGLRLPAGVRFQPTDEQLLTYYLMPKLKGEPLPCFTIYEGVDVYDHHPRDLHEIWKTRFSKRDTGMYFFSPRSKKYPNGKRPRRSMNRDNVGFWKPTGADREIKNDNGTKMGTRKCLDFYVGNHRDSRRTDWKMYEFTISPEFLPPQVANPTIDVAMPMKLDNVVLYKLYKKGEGRRNEDDDDDHEEDDDDDGEDDIDYPDNWFPETGSSSNLSVPNTHGVSLGVNDGTPYTPTAGASSSTSQPPQPIPHHSLLRIPYINQSNGDAFRHTGSVVERSDGGALTHEDVLGVPVSDFLPDDDTYFRLLHQSTGGALDLDPLQTQFQSIYYPANGGASANGMPTDPTQSHLQPSYNMWHGGPSTISISTDPTQSHLQPSYNMCYDSTSTMGIPTDATQSHLQASWNMWYGGAYESQMPDLTQAQLHSSYNHPNGHAFPGGASASDSQQLLPENPETTTNGYSSNEPLDYQFQSTNNEQL